MLVLHKNQLTFCDFFLPEQLRVFNEELSNVDHLLDDEKFMEPFLKHWDIRIRRPTVPVETYLRLMCLKYRYGFGYESPGS